MDEFSNHVAQIHRRKMKKKGWDLVILVAIVFTIIELARLL